MPKERPSLQELPVLEARLASDQSPVHAKLGSLGTKGATYPPHMHYELELGIVLRGRVRRFYGKDRRDLEAGEVWFCGMWEPHALEVLQPPYSRVALWFWPPLLTNLFCPELPRMDWMAPFHLPLDQRPQTPIARRKDVLALAERILGILEAEGGISSLLVRLVALELLAVLLEPHQSGARGRRNAPQMHGKITPALELALQTRRLVTNEEAAGLCGLSRSRFIRIFRQLMGISFATFALRYRLDGAMRQLVETDDSIKAVARDWGFTDRSHLSRLFLEHYGLPPARYRREFRLALE